MPKKRKRPGRTPRRSLSTVHSDAAGIDVGATFHVVAVPIRLHLRVQ